MAEADPRVYFAAERTMLAWLRTGLTIMAFGFVIARFGLFLKILAVQVPGAPLHVQSYVSGVFGIALVGAGTLMILAAMFQHRKFVKTLPRDDHPAGYGGGMLILACSVWMGLVGIGLTIYLAGSLD